MINKGQPPPSSDSPNDKEDEKLKATVEGIIAESEVMMQPMEQSITTISVPLPPIPGSVDTTPVKDTFDTHIIEQVRGVSRDNVQHTGDEKGGGYGSQNGTPDEPIPLKLQISQPTIVARDMAGTTETDHDSTSPVSPMSTQRSGGQEKEQQEPHSVSQAQLQQLFSQLQKAQPSLDDNSLLGNMGNIRDILQLPTSEERLKAFDEQREVFANLDIGLRTWIVYAMLQGQQNGGYMQQQTLQQPHLHDNRVQPHYTSYPPTRAPEQERRQTNGNPLQEQQRLPLQQQGVDSSPPVSPMGIYSPPMQHRNSQHSQVSRMQSQYQAYNQHEQQQESSSPVGAQLYDRPMSVATQLSAQDIQDSNYQQRIQVRQYRDQGQELRQQEQTAMTPPLPLQQVPGHLQYQAYRTDVRQQPRGYPLQQTLQDASQQGGALPPPQGYQSASAQPAVQQVSSYKQQEHPHPTQSSSTPQTQEAAPQDLPKAPNAPAMQSWPPQLARSPTMVQQQWQEEKRQIIQKNNNMGTPLGQPTTPQQRQAWQSPKMPPQQGQQALSSAPQEPQSLLVGQESMQGRQQVPAVDMKQNNKHGFRGFFAKFSKSSRLVSFHLLVNSLFKYCSEDKVLMIVIA